MSDTWVDPSLVGTEPNWPEHTPVYEHEQVQATFPNGHQTHVDAGLKTLLEALWRRGMRTEWSCQGGTEPGTLSQQGGSAEVTMFGLRGAVLGLRPSPVHSDAYVIFADFSDAVNFLRTTAELLDNPDDTVIHSWSMALRAIPPYPSNESWRGQVLWDHDLTERITELWSPDV